MLHSTIVSAVIRVVDAATTTNVDHCRTWLLAAQIDWLHECPPLLIENRPWRTIIKYETEKVHYKYQIK